MSTFRCVETLIGIIPTISIIIEISNNGWIINKKKTTILLETLALCLIFSGDQDSSSAPKEIRGAAMGSWFSKEVMEGDIHKDNLYKLEICNKDNSTWGNQIAKISILH